MLAPYTPFLDSKSSHLKYCATVLVFVSTEARVESFISFVLNFVYPLIICLIVYFSVLCKNGKRGTAAPRFYFGFRWLYWINSIHCHGRMEDVVVCRRQHYNGSSYVWRVMEVLRFTEHWSNPVQSLRLTSPSTRYCTKYLKPLYQVSQTFILMLLY